LQANPNIFEPPTAEQLAKHLENNAPAQGFDLQKRLPMLVLMCVGLALLLAGSPGFALLPMLGVLGVMTFLASRARAAQELEQQVTRAWELAMIRRYRESMGRAWELLPACRSRPDLHGRVVTILAHILGELGKDEAAEVAYMYLLDHLPPDHPLALRLRVQCAVTALGTNRLADADDTLRKLRNPVEQSDDPSLTAAYQLARLLQDMRTGHFADAIAKADHTAALLQPLGVEAGYGHGLLAVCYQQLALHDPSADLQQKKLLSQLARRWWDRATLLIPPAALLYRYPDMSVVPRQIIANTPEPTQD